MTSTYDSSFSRFLIDLNEDHDCQQLFSSSETAEAAFLSSSSSSSAVCPILVNPPLEGRGHYEGKLQPLQNQHEVNLYGKHEGSKNQRPTVNEYGLREDRQEIHSDKSLDKWMSSKMRLMKKMMNSNQTIADTPETSLKKFEDHSLLVSSSQIDNSGNLGFSNSSSTIRVCADCNTTKTPLWRSGPRGPKSLCNACGIRQRKARRAMAAAAAANGTIVSREMPKVKNKVKHKEKKASNSHLPFKKRCKFTGQARGRKKNLCFEDLTILLNKNTSFHQQVFPQDEKEAAILLMALSYGLVHG